MKIFEHTVRDTLTQHCTLKSATFIMYQTAYVVCTRERLSRKVSYFRPEKATKSAKIALSHRATYVVPLFQFTLKSTHFQNDSTAEKKN